MLTIRAMTGGNGYAQRHLQQSDYYDQQRTVFLAACFLVVYASTFRSPGQWQHSLPTCPLRFDQAGLAAARLNQKVSPARHRIPLLQTFPSAIEACSAFTSRYAGTHARQVAYATLYTEGSSGFVSSTAAPIASGWSEPSSRAGISPAVRQRLFTAHEQSGFIATYKNLRRFPRHELKSTAPKV